MKTAVRSNEIVLMALIAVVLLALVLMIVRPDFTREAPRDPHEGQVYIYDGFDWIWMTPLEGVPANTFVKEDFILQDGIPQCLRTDFETLSGVDVSEHQHDIDWKQVSDSGVDFAYIRAGRRGYTEGGLFSDPWFEKNFLGARENGLLVGVYFYSQAISVQEAEEEADFILAQLQGQQVDLPIVFDWEKVDNEDAEFARTKDLDLQTRTDCAVAFCERVIANGYDACVYFNRNLGYYGYDLTRLTPYSFWFSLPESPWPSFYYDVDLWQYSFTSAIPGIEGETDMNLLFLPISQPDQAEGET